MRPEDSSQRCGVPWQVKIFRNQSGKWNLCHPGPLGPHLLLSLQKLSSLIQQTLLYWGHGIKNMFKEDAVILKNHLKFVILKLLGLVKCKPPQLLAGKDLSHCLPAVWAWNVYSRGANRQLTGDVEWGITGDHTRPRRYPAPRRRLKRTHY